MAIVSCLLTLKLTASTSFVTRKESGVLSEDFAGTETKAPTGPSSEPKRRVLYYVSSCTTNDHSGIFFGPFSLDILLT